MLSDSDSWKIFRFGRTSVFRNAITGIFGYIHVSEIVKNQTIHSSPDLAHRLALLFQSFRDGVLNQLTQRFAPHLHHRARFMRTDC
ncbi:MAG: hypothetical protein WCC39_18380, partial [Telluria sp.]